MRAGRVAAGGDWGRKVGGRGSPQLLCLRAQAEPPPCCACCPPTCPCCAGRPPFRARSTPEAERFFVDSLEVWRREQGLDKMVLMGWVGGWVGERWVCCGRAGGCVVAAAGAGACTECRGRPGPAPSMPDAHSAAPAALVQAQHGRLPVGLLRHGAPGARAALDPHGEWVCCVFCLSCACTGGRCTCRGAPP